MKRQTQVDEDYENQVSSSSLLSTNQRASQSQLLTKIYYPDTLYPDNYSFFADRGDTASSQTKSALPMDPNEQYPTTDPIGPPTIISTLPKQPTTEIEIVDRRSKYAVSNTYLFHFLIWFFVLFTFFLFCNSGFFSSFHDIYV